MFHWLLAKISGEIWPDVYEPEGLIPYSDLGMHLIEQGDVCNIVLFQSIYFVVPKTLNTIELTDLAQREHLVAFQTYSLSQAQRFLQKMRHSRTSERTLNFMAIPAAP